MVGVTYTDVNGKVTAFGSDSPDKAIERLRGIASYRGNAMDGLAAQLAQSVKARGRDRAAGFDERMSGFRASGRGNRDFASAQGRTTEMSSVSGVRVEDGKLVVDTRKDVFSESGKAVSSRGASTTSIPIPSGTGNGEGTTVELITAANMVQKDGRVQLETSVLPVKVLSSSPASMVKKSFDIGVRGEIRCVLGVSYDMETHKLLQQMGTVKVENGQLVAVADEEPVEITTAVPETIVR